MDWLEKLRLWSQSLPTGLRRRRNPTFSEVMTEMAKPESEVASPHRTDEGNLVRSIERLTSLGVDTSINVPVQRVSLQEISQHIDEGKLSKFDRMQNLYSSFFTQADKTGKVAQGLVTLWQHTVQSRREYIAISDELNRFYLVSAILKQYADDTLNPNELGESIKLSSKNPEYNEKLVELQERFNCDSITKRFIKRYLDFGEYTLRISVDDKTNTKGVTGINDDLNQVAIAALYEQGEPVRFFAQQNGQFLILPPKNFAHFVSGEELLRVKLHDALVPGQQLDMMAVPQEVADQIPDYIHYGEPLFYGMAHKLRELQILEQLIPAIKLNMITSARLISMKVPAGMPVDQVIEALGVYEQALNSQQGIDVTTDSLTLADIINVAGRYKILPNFADEKGSLNPVDARNDNNVDDLLNSIGDARNCLLSSLGIPYSLLFGASGHQTEEDSKRDELRVYSRYARRLRQNRLGLICGWKQIGLAHLVYSGFENATSADVNVEFLNSILDVGELEKLEFDQGAIAILNDFLEFAANLKGNPITAEGASEEGLELWLEKSLQVLSHATPVYLSSATRQKLADDEAEEDGIFDGPIDLSKAHPVSIEIGKRVVKHFKDAINQKVDRLNETNGKQEIIGKNSITEGVDSNNE